MEFNRKTERYPYIFIALFALIYMCLSVYNVFIPLYLKSAGFNNATIGALMALAPFVAIFAQPLWGTAGDRSKFKNNVLMLMVAGSAFSILSYPRVKGFMPMFMVMAVFTFFYSPVLSMSDAISLEYLEKTKWKYGPIRMAGTVGYSFMAVGAGVFIKKNINSMFTIFFLTSMVTLLAILFVPKIKGHQRTGEKISMLQLLKNRELLMLMIFNFLIQTSIAFYTSFFSIHFKSLGADDVLLGWSQFISAMSEIPFLFFADKIIYKLGTKRTMIIASLVLSLRWFLLGTLTDTHMLLWANALHGFGYIVLQYCMALYINNNIPMELKATGQALNGFVTVGISRVVGSIVGGVLSQYMGIKQSFLYDAVFAFSIAIVFAFIFAKNRPNICKYEYNKI